MGTGTLAMWVLLGSLGAGEPPFPMKDRNISIPYNLSVNAAEISDVVLYVSIDQGKFWSRAGSIKPTEKAFPFQAPTDGIYWFNVAVVYRNGNQVPADVSQTPPQQKVLFDTQKPLVRVGSAERVGDDVIVQWDIQEPNPELATLKLEYRPTDATAGGFWYSVSASPGLTGQARFRANTPAPITVKLSIQDTAGNLGWVERSVGMGNRASPAPSQHVMQTTSDASAANSSNPPLTPPQGVEPLSLHIDSPSSHHAPLATSQRNTSAMTNRLDVPPPTPGSGRTDLPEIIFTNEPQLTIDYEIERQGPSVISKVEVFLTQDEGRTWMKWQELVRNDANHGELGPATSLPVTIRLPEREGLFGFRIVPFSGSQLSVGAPQAGDAPEMRIQLDKSVPYVELFKPEADPKDPNILILQWLATDTNLTRTPIRIYYSESPDGDWKPVNPGGIEPTASGMSNTGRHSWMLPPGLPLKVFLKIVAEDKAGNIGEAITPQPVVVDVHKPVGRVKGVVKTRN